MPAGVVTQHHLFQAGQFWASLYVADRLRPSFLRSASRLLNHLMWHLPWCLDHYGTSFLGCSGDSIGRSEHAMVPKNCRQVSLKSWDTGGCLVSFWKILLHTKSSCFIPSICLRHLESKTLRLFSSSVVRPMCMSIF